MNSRLNDNIIKLQLQQTKEEEKLKEKKNKKKKFFHLKKKPTKSRSLSYSIF